MFYHYPSSLQRECVMKILRCMGHSVVVGKSDVKFDHDTGVPVPKSGDCPEGYTAVPVSDREHLQQVTIL